MKRTILASTAALALAACSAEQPANNVTVTANDLGAVANDQVPSLPEPPTAAANETSPPRPDAATPPAKAEPAREPRRAPAPPRPAPKAEPVDPHAGHDMGNMANMSR